MNTSISQAKPVITAADLPRIFGTQDAQHGASCLPELYFTHPSDKLEYAQGFESVAGETLLSRQIKQLFGGNK